MGGINVRESRDPEHDIQRELRVSKGTRRTTSGSANRPIAAGPHRYPGNRVLRIVGAQSEIAKDEIFYERIDTINIRQMTVTDLD